MPRQRRASNNCGMFALEDVEKILDNTEQFEEQAKSDGLSNWFSVQSVDKKRQQVAEEVIQTAEDQRKSGGKLEGRPPLVVTLPHQLHQQLIDK